MTLIIDRPDAAERLVLGSGNGSTIVVDGGGGTNFAGTWNVATNTPALESIRATLTDGDYYVVSTGGTLTGADILNSHSAYADLDTFVSGDWAVWNDTQGRFLKIDNASLLARANNWQGLNRFYGDSSGNSQLRNMGTIAHAKDVITKEYYDARETYINSTSLTVQFATPKQHAASFDASTGVPTPLTGNISQDLVGAVSGCLQKIYHNHTVAPTFPTNWVKLGYNTYQTSVLNIIHAEYVAGNHATDARVEYWIIQ